MQGNYSLQDLDKIVQQLWEAGKAYSVWTFSGDMGAGKTTLISALCRHLHVTDAVSSPTYALVNEYEGLVSERNCIIYHCDWYRLRNADEAREAGMEDMLFRPGTYAFIEWASRAPELLSRTHFSVTIKVISETERSLTAAPKG